jgi:enoyl-CoA hydratase/carnithine racemase
VDLKTDKMIAEKDGAIGWMTFNNPERRNAISREMRGAAAEILADFQADPAIRVVVMKGAGDKAFVSGADISEFDKTRANAAQAEQVSEESNAMHAAMEALDKPLIAMIRGYCLGGGLGVALQADMRIAAADCRFGIPAGRLGVAYRFDAIDRLVNLVGPVHATDILFTARQLSAEEALGMGLIHRVVLPERLEAATRELVETIAANAPLSVRSSKVCIRELAKESGDRDMVRVREAIRACFDSADYKEGRLAFKEKRKPVFTGR